MNHTVTDKSATDIQDHVPFSRRMWPRAAWMLLALVAGAGMWIYVLTMWPASQEKLSDLYPRWYGTRELLLHHRDPYSQEVSREIQYWIFGRLAAPGEDQGRFAYPVYVSFLLWPTIYSSFSAVNVFSFWLLLLFGAASAVGFARFVGWPRSNYALALVVLLAGCSYPFAFAARLRQLSLLVGFFLAAALVTLARHKHVAAGALLALATIKPQLMVLLLPWLLLWTLADWKHRRRLFWSFTVSMAVLAIISDILVPGWIPEFLGSVSSYARYTHAASILQFLLSDKGATVATVLLVAALAIQCWRLRSCEANSLPFVLCTALALAITLIVIPTLAPHGQMLLAPAVLLLIEARKLLWRKSRLYRDALLGAGMIVIWPWVAAVIFSAALVLGFSAEREQWLIPVSTIPLTALAVAIALLLCRRPILEQ